MNGLFGNNFSMMLPMLFGRGFCNTEGNNCCNEGCGNGMNNILPLLLLMSMFGGCGFQDCGCKTC